MLTPLALGMPGPGEWIIIAAIALLFFGKRLPEVGRSLGKGIVEFKKGLKGIEDEIDTSTPAATAGAQPRIAAPANKFDPYTGKPLDPGATSTPASTPASTPPSGGG